MLRRWSRRAGWGHAHRFAVAAGALLTYVWLGFAHAPAVGIPFPISIIGNIVCGAIAIILLVRAVHLSK